MRTPLTYMGLIRPEGLDSPKEMDELSEVLQQLSSSLGYTPEAQLLMKSLHLIADRNSPTKAGAGANHGGSQDIALPADTSGHLVAA